MAHRRILTKGQRRALFDLPDDEGDARHWYVLDEADLALVRRRRKPENRLGFALQLCALRFPGRLLRPGEVIPFAMLRVIAEQIGTAWEVIEGYGQRANTRYEHSSALQAELGYRPFAGAVRQDTLRWLGSAAVHAPDGADLAEGLVARLREARVIVPRPSTVERLCSTALVDADRFVERRLTEGLLAHHVRTLSSLLEVEPDTRLTPLGMLRRPVDGIGVEDFRDLVARLERLRALTLPDPPNDLPARRIVRLARECERISVAHLRELGARRRTAMLAAFVADARTRFTDAALDLALRLIGSLFKRAERRHLDALAEHRRGIGEVVIAHADLGAALIRARTNGEDLEAAIAGSIGWSALERSTDTAARLRTPVGGDTLERIEGEHPRLRRFGKLLLETFTFRGTRQTAGLLAAVERVRKNQVDATASLDPVTPAWRRLVLADGGFNAKLYELCVFARLREALRAGEVWVDGSIRYRPLEDRLMAPAVLAAASTGPAAALQSIDAATWLAGRRDRLDALLAEAERRAAADDLPEAAIRNGRLSVSPVRASTPDPVRALARRLYALLPRVRITDLLEEVDGWTDMGACFSHLRTGHAPADRRGLYAAILADGLNLGLTRMAEACESASFWQLARLVDWHVREESYALATRTLTEAQARVPLAELWGDGSTSSSDGQYFPAAGRARAATMANLRHGTEPGVSFYTHLSDQFAPFATRAIAAAAPEAPHVLDGILQHRGRVPIREHHTDTGGFTDHVFALCALLGYRFAPRIRDLPDKRLYVFDTSPAAPTLAPLIARHARADTIAAHWPEIVRVAASIAAGHVSAAHAITTLGAATRRTGLAAALAEIGRIERTIFMLEWMLDPALRQRVQMGLNKGEGRNNLARAVFFNRLGQLRDRSHENHQHRAAGCNLVVAAIVLWNTVYLSRAVETLRLAGIEVPDDLLAHVWPLAWDHILLTGDYRWSPDNPSSAETLRPLRLEQLRLPIGPPSP